MPEGPEIRLAADEIASALVGQTVERIEFSFEHLKRFEPELTARKIIAIETRGKAMLSYFDNEWVIYSHNQLYGRWYVCRAGDKPDIGRQLRLNIETKHKAALLYSASDIEVLKKHSLYQHPFLAKLGPDILSEQPSADSIYQRLNAKPFRNRQLANLLLDQGFLAGLGTYLCAEILFIARLHPRVKPSNCLADELKRLSSTIIKITNRSYQTRGVTNPPALVKTLKALGKADKEAHRFSVYRRGGENCYRCEAEIERFDIGGRPMYFCPCCQEST